MTDLYFDTSKDISMELSESNDSAEVVLNDNETFSVSFDNDYSTNDLNFNSGDSRVNMSLGEYYGSGGGTCIARAIITPEFGTRSTYNIGDYTIHENRLYICVATTTGTTWVANHWAETNVADHMTNSNIHVTQTEKNYWNNKVSARYGNTETLFLEV